MIVALCIVLFLALLLLGLDVGFSMIAAALIGLLLHPSGGIDPAVVALTLVSAVDSEALVAVPLFVLAGEIMNHGGLTRRLIDWSMAMVGHFRGALSQAAMTTNLVMAGISGSAVSDATATGAILIPAMKDDGYKPGYAAAVIAAGAMLGPIIPPSIPMLVYAILSNLSIGRLFLSGVVPGLLLFAGFVVICAVIARRRGYAARVRAPWRERLRETRSASWALMVPVLIVAGIRSGLITETEAAGVICVYALVVGLLVYRDLKPRELGTVFFGAARTSGVILFLLAAVVVVNLMVGMLHPPVGLLVLITAAIGRCSLWSVAWETLPFLAWSLVVLAAMTVFPQISTALPTLVMGR